KPPACDACKARRILCHPKPNGLPCPRCVCCAPKCLPYRDYLMLVFLLVPRGWAVLPSSDPDSCNVVAIQTPDSQALTSISGTTTPAHSSFTSHIALRPGHLAGPLELPSEVLKPL
ncbi:hypothetical protein B0H17DRAFT_1106365, partial [Mycena rosella]